MSARRPQLGNTWQLRPQLPACNTHTHTLVCTSLNSLNACTRVCTHSLLQLLLRHIWSSNVFKDDGDTHRAQESRLGGLQWVWFPLRRRWEPVWARLAARQVIPELWSVQDSSRHVSLIWLVCLGCRGRIDWWLTGTMFAQQQTCFTWSLAFFWDCLIKIKGRHLPFCFGCLLKSLTTCTFCVFLAVFILLECPTAGIHCSTVKEEGSVSVVSSLWGGTQMLYADFVTGQPSWKCGVCEVLLQSDGWFVSDQPTVSLKTSAALMKSCWLTLAALKRWNEKANAAVSPLKQKPNRPWLWFFFSHRGHPP